MNTKKTNDQEKISVCKYAGDTNDEFCTKCDGITIVEDGKKFAATECGGYESSEKISEETKPIKEEKTSISDKKETENKPVEVKNAPVVNTAPKEAVKSTAESDETGADQVKGAMTVDYTRMGIITAIRAESGATIEMKGKDGLSRWYKFGYTEERSIPEGADLESEKTLLWNDVNEEIDRQIAEVKEFMQKS